MWGRLLLRLAFASKREPRLLVAGRGAHGQNTRFDPAVSEEDTTWEGRDVLWKLVLSASLILFRHGLGAVDIEGFFLHQAGIATQMEWTRGDSEAKRLASREVEMTRATF